MQWMFEGLLHARLQYFAFVYALCLHVESQPATAGCRAPVSPLQ